MPKGGVSLGEFSYEKEIVIAEHESSANVRLKKAGVYGWNSDALEWVKLKVDSSGNITIIESGFSTIGTGRKTVSTPGVAVAIAASTTVKKVIIQAIVDNTDVVYLGDSNVDAADGSERGIGIYASNVIELRADDLANIYVDSRVAGEGITFYFEV